MVKGYAKVATKCAKKSILTEYSKTNKNKKTEFILTNIEIKKKDLWRSLEKL